MKFTEAEIYHDLRNKPLALAEKLNQFAHVKVVAGANGAVALGDTPEAIIAVFAVTTATGAVATKFLLAPTMDYTISGATLTCVTDQSANTLIVVYK